MSVLSALKPAPGSRHKKHRLGRGKGSGKGGTSTKGHKGQKARSGYKAPKGFEGGGMPLIRRLPKFGFSNRRFQTRYEILNVGHLNRFDGEVNPQVLYQSGMIKKKALVKILGKGELKKALKVQAHKFSAEALKAIQKARGQALVLDQNKKQNNEVKTNT